MSSTTRLLQGVVRHDWLTDLITGTVITGLFISYAPLHYLIIASKPSEGLSLLFLLLGSTSSAAGIWNISVCVVRPFVLLLSGMECPGLLCNGVWRHVVSWRRCIEMTAGVFQVSVQWFCFTLIFVLYMKFYPEHHKYVQFELEAPDDARISPMQIKTPAKSSEWRSSLLCAWVTLGHFVFSAITTLYLILTAVPTPAPDVPLPASAQIWATFLLLGLFFGVALRPGTNWTSWFTFLVAGVMQVTLLVMCIAWKFRQRRLGIDDFGNPVVLPVVAAGPMESGRIVVDVSSDAVVEDERTPLVRV